MAASDGMRPRARLWSRCRTIAETATVAGFWLVLKCQNLLVLWCEGPTKPWNLSYRGRSFNGSPGVRWRAGRWDRDGTAPRPNGTASARFESWIWPISRHRGFGGSVGRFGVSATRQRAVLHRGFDGESENNRDRRHDRRRTGLYRSRSGSGRGERRSSFTPPSGDDVEARWICGE